MSDQNLPAVASDADTFTAARVSERTNKKGELVTKIVVRDTIGVMNSGNAEERHALSHAAMSRAIAACNFISALHNMRRVWPINALKSKKGAPNADGIVFTDPRGHYYISTFDNNAETTHLYSSVCNKAGTAKLYALAIVRKAGEIQAAGKTIKGEKAIVLQYARAVIDRLNELDAARAAREVTKLAAPAVEAA